MAKHGPNVAFACHNWASFRITSVGAAKTLRNTKMIFLLGMAAIVTLDLVLFGKSENTNAPKVFGQ